MTTKTKEQFIQNAIKIHGDKYDYSLVIYKHSKTPITIICKLHGKFIQKPYIHLMGCGCPICVLESRSKTKEEYITICNKIHKNKYDYSVIDQHIILRQSLIKIICPLHGNFQQIASYHLEGNGCPDCCHTKKYTNDTFIKQANIIHNNKYNYSLLDYKNSITNVKIICPKHGVFISDPGNHLNCASGCPKCTESKGEIKIRLFLENNNIEYTYQKRYKDCKHKRTLPFDFYISNINLCIEYDGPIHYKRDQREKDDFGLECRKMRDKIKDDYCRKNNINLLRIPYWDYKNIEKILDDIMSLYNVNKNK
jgi:very-short-patch-repair endonuclease